jgi:hypothetical protein
MGRNGRVNEKMYRNPLFFLLNEGQGRVNATFIIVTHERVVVTVKRTAVKQQVTGRVSCRHAWFYDGLRPWLAWRLLSQQ